MWKWWKKIHYSGTWWTCSQAHHCCSWASGNRGLLSELDGIPAVRMQGRLRGRPLTPLRRMWARVPCSEEKKCQKEALVVKMSLEAEMSPWGLFTGHNITWHSRKLCFATTCLISVVLATVLQGYNNMFLTNLITWQHWHYNGVQWDEKHEPWDRHSGCKQTSNFTVF